jgi:hypothetical protein
VCGSLLQAFFPSTLGEVTLHPLSQACMFIYSSCGKWVFPPVLWSFPPMVTFTSFPSPDCWACAAAPASQHVCLQLTWEVGLPLSPVEFSFLHHSHKLSCSSLLGARRSSCPLWPGPACLFTVLGRIPLPLLVLRVPHPFWHVSLFSYCLLLSFSFSLGGGRSVQGAMLIWPRVVCGSTAYHLSHLVCIFPSHLAVGDWRPRGPPDFSI